MIPRRFSATPSFIGKLTVITLLLVYLWYWRPYRSSFQQEADRQSPQSIGTGTDQTSTISEHFNLHRQLMLGDYQLPSLLSSVTSSQPKVAIVTMYRSKAAELKPFTMENKKAYAKRHGYAFHDAQEDQMLRERLDKEPARNVLLTKFMIMEHYLKIYDWVMWSDSDALFLNHSRSLKAAGVLDERFSMIVAAGHPMDWKWGKVVNTGHFVMRKSSWSFAFLARAWSFRPKPGAQCPPIADNYGTINNWLRPCAGSGDGLWYWTGDQGVFHALMRSSRFPSLFDCHVKWVNMRDMDSELPWFDDGDLVLHLPGKSNAERIPIFEQVLRTVQFETGTRAEGPDRLESGLHGDWRVKPGLFSDYLGVGWNVPCQDMFYYYH